VSNRYGGKGVISKVVPDNEMPVVNGKIVDIIFNQGTVNNRENLGQLFEVSVNDISEQIVDMIKTGKWSLDECFANIIKFRQLVVPELANFTIETLSKMDVNQKRFFLDSIINDGIIDTSARPVSESMDIFKLRDLYRAFPWVEQKTMIVTMKNSKGQIRKVEARRKVLVGTEYIYRLKQFAEEKFSATSLSSTNIKGLNTKSKASKNFNEMYSNTPIRFGNMEQLCSA
jgi:DNA-directed RNA polymerase beta subunit